MKNYKFSLDLTILIVFLALLSGCATTEKLPVTTSQSKQHEGNVIAVVEAMKLQGHPYVFGGKSPQEGFDCSGLVVYVFNRQGLKLPRSTKSLAQQLPNIPPEKKLPGDLLFFNTAQPFSHVGIYVGDDNFVHAPSAKTGRVMVSSLRQPYWRERFIAVRRPLHSQPLSLNTTDDSSCSFN